MTRRLALLVAMLLGVSVVGGGRPVLAQDDPRPDSAVVDSTRSWQDDAWTPIVSQSGLDVRYIFYSEADNANNGVVLRLHNRNAVAVRYHFTVIFRTPTDERTAEVDGVLEPGEMKTGESDGLFWIPFPDGQSIGEIGLRGLDVEKAEGELGVETGRREPETMDDPVDATFRNTHQGEVAPKLVYLHVKF